MGSTGSVATQVLELAFYTLLLFQHLEEAADIAVNAR